jgi:hypothetical protein
MARCKYNAIGGVSGIKSGHVQLDYSLGDRAILGYDEFGDLLGQLRFRFELCLFCICYRLGRKMHNSLVVSAVVNADISSITLHTMQVLGFTDS